METATKVIKGLMATKLTAEQMYELAETAGAYNPRTWRNDIERMGKYKDVVYYRVPVGNGYEYERFYMAYTLPEGLRLFSRFQNRSMTNGGFAEAFICEWEFSEIGDPITFYPDNQVRIFTREIYFKNDDGTHTEGRLSNTDQARRYMADMCQKYGRVYTKDKIG